jgi:5-methylcytosine-specific restriction endonuclease McrBC regulatory subunit McrC
MKYLKSVLATIKRFVSFLLKKTPKQQNLDRVNKIAELLDEHPTRHLTRKQMVKILEEFEIPKK